MRKLLALLFLITAINCATAYHGQSIQVSPLQNLYRAQQPQSQVDLESITNHNPNFIVYRLSANNEGGVTIAQETTWVENLGGKLVYDSGISYPFPTKFNLKAAAYKINSYLNAGKTVIVHCKRGKDRTGGVIAAWQIIFTNLSLDEILKQRDSYLSTIDELIDTEETLALKSLAENYKK